MNIVKKIAGAFVAAVTSPQAVKLERNLAALVIFRLALAAGASYGLAELVSKIVHG